MNRAIIGYLTTAALLLGPSAHAVRAETLNCTPVTSLPATINSQGIHCLTGNLATAITSGVAISITTNNVTLDLNGWKLGGQAAGNSTNAVGIFSAATNANVTVRNGIVRGFSTGIFLRGRGAVVEDMLVDQNTGTGIQVEGQGSIVRRNQVVDTGGSSSSPNTPTGISAAGDGSLIADNLISGLTRTGIGGENGILIFGADTLVTDNFVTDSDKPSGGSLSVGVLMGGATNVNVLNNTVSNMNNCILYANPATGIYAGNTVTGCDTEFSGGTAGQQGNNFIAP